VGLGGLWGRSVQTDSRSMLPMKPGGVCKIQMSSGYGAQVRQEELVLTGKLGWWGS
jgi:hypothetical protein